MTPVSVQLLLIELGIDAKQRGTKWLAKCPSPGHQDRNPSWFIRDDPGERWHGSHACLSCGFDGGPWELYAAVRGCTLEAAAAAVRALSGAAPAPRDLPTVRVRVPRLTEYAMPSGFCSGLPLGEWPKAFRDYAHGRGVTADQAARWGIGYATSGDLKWRLVVPVRTAGKLRAYVARAIFDDGSKRYDMPTRQSGARPDVALWGEPSWQPGPVAVVCEGVFGGLSLERAGAPNVAALLGSQLTDGKVLALSSALRAASSQVLYACTDPDPAGDKAAAQLAAKLGRHVEVRRVRLSQSPDDLSVGELRSELLAAGIETLRK